MPQVPTLMGRAVRLSSRDIPEPQRAAVLREEIGRAKMRIDIEPVDPRAFFLETHILPLAGVTYVGLSMASMKMVRTRELTADGDDDLQIGTPGSGEATFWTPRQECRARPGENVLISLAEPASSLAVRPHHCRTLKLKRTFLSPLVSNLDDQLVRPLGAGNAAFMLLWSYVGTLLNMPASPDPEFEGMVSRHIYDLVAAALGVRRDAHEQVCAGGVQAARLARIKRDIQKNLQDPEISIGWVARRHAISPSYVKRLFERAGENFTDFVLEQRLAAAYRLLGGHDQEFRSISAVAYAVGFGDLSYFNRSFRRRYAATPSDIRFGRLR